MRRLLRLIGLLAAMVSTPAYCQVEDERAAVIVAVVNALGASGTAPSYANELQTARTQTAHDFFCKPDHPYTPFPTTLRDEIIRSVLSTLQAGDHKDMIEERPAHLMDLITVAITSFEYGKLLSMSAPDRAALCV
jgi:hypothetical protein